MCFIFNLCIVVYSGFAFSLFFLDKAHSVAFAQLRIPIVSILTFISTICDMFGMAVLTQHIAAKIHLAFTVTALVLKYIFVRMLLRRYFCVCSDSASQLS